jgi:hypothetical protein
MRDAPAKRVGSNVGNLASSQAAARRAAWARWELGAGRSPCPRPAEGMLASAGPAAPQFVMRIRLKPLSVSLHTASGAPGNL